MPKNKSVILFSIRKMGWNIKRIRHLPIPFLYIALNIIFTSAYLTAGISLTIVSRQELQISETAYTLALILKPVASIVGNVFFLNLQRSLTLSTRSILILILFLHALGPLVPVLGLFSATLGMRHPWEYFLVSTWYSFLIGALLSTDRVMLAELVPVEDASEFYAIHGIANRLGGVLGPIITGYVADLTGQFRHGQLAIALLFFITLPGLLWILDMKKAKLHISQYEKIEALNYGTLDSGTLSF